MQLIIKKIPANSQLGDIKEFILPALKRVFPFKVGQIHKVKVLVLRDKLTHQYEFYGLVDIEPDKACLRAIEKLKNQRFKNKPVIVKEYFNRDWHNDRRINFAGVNPKILERRSGDRRRGNQLEVIEDISNLFHATGEARKLI